MEKFDLEIRSMMEDAEVKPSRRVWKAVSSRLQDKETDSFVWMRWAGLCAAFAAVALGVFLSINRSEKNVPILTETSSGAMLSQTLPAAETPEISAQLSAGNIAEAPRPAPSQKPASAETVTEDPAVAPESLTVLSPVPASEPEPETASVATLVPERESAPVQDYVPLGWEEEKKESKPFQLYAQGSLLGNESDFNFRKSRSYGSSGVSTVKTGIIELGESSYGIPFSLGLGVRFYLCPKLALGTGLDYSYLSRRFKGKYVNQSLGISESGDVTHQMHYIGIPVNLSYDFVSTKRIKVYALAGFEAEYCVANKYRTAAASASYDYSSPTKGLQWSVGAGAGVEFLFTKWLGLYLDPGIRYYFDCNQPKSVRTEKPVMVNFDAGLRFGF